jgi:ribosomal protein S18 acetylase RimI-like enzyme
MVDAAVREMTVEDYDAALALWREAEGLHLHTEDVDSREAVAGFLARQAGMSFVAVAEGRIVGAVLCGTDGRRGYLHHLAVSPAWRGHGIGGVLAERCVEALAERGIPKCHAFVYASNVDGRNFWAAVGWALREEMVVVSKNIPPGAANPP